MGGGRVERVGETHVIKVSAQSPSPNFFSFSRNWLDLGSSGTGGLGIGLGNERVNSLLSVSLCLVVLQMIPLHTIRGNKRKGGQ